jgi:regulator of RNase E activity RraA
MKRRNTLLAAVLLVAGAPVMGQQISKDELIFLTPQWQGERFEDGRPKVSDDILKRMKLVTLEEAWSVLRGERFNYQFSGEWKVLNPDTVLVGRAVTATFMPGRPDIHAQIDKRGREQGRSGSQNSWPVDMLKPGDVYVADQFDIYEDGPTVGDNLANAILGNSGNGFIYYGPIRDIAGMKKMKDFVVYYRSYTPTHHNPAGKLNTTLVGINQPTRIGDATVMPGDVVLARDGAVLFIPPHLAQRVVETSEVVRLRDMFGHERLREGKYTAGQIDTRWTDAIERDFSQWMEKNAKTLPVSEERVRELLKTRTY